MRIGTAISVAAHIAGVAACLVFAGSRPFDPVTAEAITVDLVTPDQAPPLPEDHKPADDKPEPSFPQDTVTEPEKSSPPPPAEQAASPPPPPATPPAPKDNPTPPSSSAANAGTAAPAAPEPPPSPTFPPQPAPPAATPDITQKYGMSFAMPGSDSDFDAKATAAANIKREDAAALRAHLKRCSILPKSVQQTDNVKITLRVSFRQDGTLARPPLLIEASASDKGPALMRNAIDALEKCQPYSMLPADRYNEWRMLDLSFTPKDFTG